MGRKVTLSLSSISNPHEKPIKGSTRRSPKSAASPWSRRVAARKLWASHLSGILFARWRIKQRWFHSVETVRGGRIRKDVERIHLEISPSRDVVCRADELHPTEKALYPFPSNSTLAVQTENPSVLSGLPIEDGSSLSTHETATFPR